MAVSNLANRIVMNAKSCGCFADSQRAIAYISNILLCELRRAVALATKCHATATKAVSKLMTPARKHVRNVVGISAPAKMRGVAARRIVARMQSQQTVWPWPARKTQGNVRCFLYRAANANPAITTHKPMALPFPAIIRAALINLSPKAGDALIAQRHAAASCARTVATAFESDSALMTPAVAASILNAKAGLHPAPCRICVIRPGVTPQAAANRVSRPVSARR
jgi:hypothetical protein